MSNVLSAIIKFFEIKPEYILVGEAHGLSLSSEDFPEQIPNWIRKKTKKLKMPYKENQINVYKFKGKKYRYKIETFIYPSDLGTCVTGYKFYRKRRNKK